MNPPAPTPIPPAPPAPPDMAAPPRRDLRGLLPGLPPICARVLARAGTGRARQTV